MTKIAALAAMPSFLALTLAGGPSYGLDRADTVERGEWSCTYPDFSPAHKLTIVRYKRVAGGLDEVSPSLLPGLSGQEVMKYKITWETDDALLAASTGSEYAQGANAPTVYSFIVMINKRTGDYTRGSIVAPDDGGTGHTSGKCVED
jgi:hypothetical protein